MGDIRVEELGGRGRYLRDTPDGQETYLTFQRDSPTRMSITYSFVPPAWRGRGLAAALVERAVEDARAGGYLIRPLCGYVAAEFRRHKDWQDVLER